MKAAKRITGRGDWAVKNLRTNAVLARRYPTSGEASTAAWRMNGDSAIPRYAEIMVRR